VPIDTVHFEDFELDRRAYELRRGGSIVHLERIPFDLLNLLVERRGELVTRREILEQIWGKDVYVDADNSINTAVRKIRQALHDNPEKPRFVVTIPARGYRFVAPVEKPVALPAEIRRPSFEGQELRAAATVREKPKRRWELALSSGLVVAIVAVAVLVHPHRAPALTEKDTIVIADFANSTGDAVFDDTLKQALSVQLSQSPFLNILPDKKMSETLQMMGHPADERVAEKTALEICQRRHSAAVLSGSITRLGSQYVIGLNAVNCRTGEFLAKQQVRANRKEDVLKAVDQVAMRLRGELGESLSALQKFDVPLEEATTPSLEALRAYSLGQKTLTAKADYRGAMPLFQRAISLDPNFAMAYASIAASYSDLGENTLGAENIQKAYELRERVTDRERFHIEAEYYDTITGEVEKSLQVCELWEQTYPRDFAPHFIAGNNYDLLGRYEEALLEARESLRLDPEDGLTNTYLAFSYLVLDQLEPARITLQDTQAKKLDSPPVHFLLYWLAFIGNDSEAMGREMAWAAGEPGSERAMIADEAGAAAYHGQLSKARRLSQRAIGSAESAGESEVAAEYEADAALREALFGNAGRVEKWTAAALAGSADRMVQFAAILAMTIARDSARAQALAADMKKRFPQATIVKFNFLPTIEAQLALSRNNPSQAIEALQSAAPYELGIAGADGFGTGLYPVYVRGEAYLAAGRGSDGAAEFQKILGHPYIVGTEAIGPLARLGLARAYALQGDTVKARAMYQNFLTLWKDADPDIPIFIAAKSEYAKLK
jgi:DNA-binding winged helix-turn-helix (wHTH) protein/tetratricopeptide (TPR) repeat protein